MKKFLCLAALVAAAAATKPAALVLDNNGNDCRIEWDGSDLTIPQHTAVLANHTREIDDLKKQVGTMSTKLDNLYDLVHHFDTGLAKAHSEINLNDKDISTNAKSINLNKLDIDTHDRILAHSPLNHHWNGSDLCANGSINTTSHECNCDEGFAGGGQWQKGSPAYPACAPVLCPTSASGTHPSCMGPCKVGYSGAITGWDTAKENWIGTCTAQACPNGRSETDHTQCTGACDEVGFSGTVTWQASKQTWSACTAVPCPDGVSETDHTKCASHSYSYTILHELVDCNSDDKFLGIFDTIDECADKCAEQEGCQFFLYGRTNGRAGKCWWEKTESALCTEGFEDHFYDFAEITRSDCDKVGFSGGTSWRADTKTWAPCSCAKCYEGASCSESTGKPVLVKLYNKDYGDENSVSIDGIEQTSLSNGKSDTMYVAEPCLEAGKKHLLTEDSYGDGWHGGYVEILGEDYGKDFTDGKSAKFNFYVN